MSKERVRQRSVSHAAVSSVSRPQRRQHRTAGEPVSALHALEPHWRGTPDFAVLRVFFTSLNGYFSAAFPYAVSELVIKLVSELVSELARE